MKWLLLGSLLHKINATGKSTEFIHNTTQRKTVIIRKAMCICVHYLLAERAGNRRVFIYNECEPLTEVHTGIMRGKTALLCVSRFSSDTQILPSINIHLNIKITNS